MKQIKYLSIILLLALCIAPLSTIHTDIANAQEKDIFNLMTPEIVAFYEKDFNPTKPITSMSIERRENLLKTYNLSNNKLTTLLLLQDIASLNGNKITLEKLSKMSVKELIKFGKYNFKTYLDKLPKERREKIKKDFNNLNFKLRF